MPKLRTRRAKTQSTVDYLTKSLAQIEADVIRSSTAGSWQAVFSGKRLAITTRRDLDEALKAVKPLDGALESMPEG